MIVSSINNVKNGWFIGNFPKAVFQSKDFEVCWRIHPAGQDWDLHYQQKSTEINLLINGKMILNGQDLISGDIFIIEPYEITDVKFIEDCSIVCVKTPSIPEDKIIIKKVIDETSIN